MPKYEYVTLYQPLPGNVLIRAKVALEGIINEQAAKGYRLHTLSVVSLGKKVMGFDQLEAIMVFEKVIE